MIISRLKSFEWFKVLKCHSSCSFNGLFFCFKHCKIFQDNFQQHKEIFLSNKHKFKHSSLALEIILDRIVLLRLQGNTLIYINIDHCRIKFQYILLLFSYELVYLVD